MKGIFIVQTHETKMYRGINFNAVNSLTSLIEARKWHDKNTIGDQRLVQICWKSTKMPLKKHLLIKDNCFSSVLQFAQPQNERKKCRYYSHIHINNLQQTYKSIISYFHTVSSLKLICLFLRDTITTITDQEAYKLQWRHKRRCSSH